MDMMPRSLSRRAGESPRARFSDLSGKALLLLAGFALALSFPAAALAAFTERISVSTSGTQADSDSMSGDISSDGRYVAFASCASNLAPGDTNSLPDVLVRDRQTGITERVSVSSSGEGGNDCSLGASVSADGRYVAFSSPASNLVPGDVNAVWDAFVRDRVAGTTERVSVSSAGGEADRECYVSDISGDGRYVVFQSDASNLVPGDTNGAADVFVHDRQTGTTERVSVSTTGAEANGYCGWAPKITPDGRYVVFVGWASNLVPEDTNGVSDIFVRDREAGVTERVSLSSAGQQGDGDCYWPGVSADGRYVVFTSWAGNLVAGDTNGVLDVFVRDRLAGVTERVSIASSGAQVEDSFWWNAISGDGQFVVFSCTYEDYQVMCGSIFLRDRLAGTTERVDVSITGEANRGSSWFPSISADGKHVSFASSAPDLVAGDTNEFCDVFVRDFSLRFADVPTDYWAFSEVEACAAAGIVAGYPGDLYHPTWPVTRAQMAVYISRALAGGDANIPDPGCDSPPFPDVPCDYWARKYIQYAVTHGIVQGYEDAYHPEDPVTRDQMAVYIARALCGGESGVADPGCTEPVFPDVACDFWARKHIQLIKSEGVTGGYPDGLYHPEVIVTRDQMAVYIARAFDLL